MALSLPFLSLMLKFRNSELQQPRRLRQIKRQIKKTQQQEKNKTKQAKYICALVTILRLLLFARIPLLTNYAKNGPVVEP